MKIAYLSSSQIPSKTANSIHVMKMCQAIANEGHQVTLLAFKDIGNKLNQYSDIYSFYGINRNAFQVVRLPVLKFGGRFFLNAPFAALIANHFKMDLIYCRNISIAASSLLFRKPLILELHAPVAENSRLVEHVLERLFKSTLVIRIVVITHALKRFLENKYPYIRSKVIVAPDAADPINSDAVQSINLPNAGKRLQIGYVGHLYAGKGMEVVSRLAASCQWADFHVVGGRGQDIEYWETISKAEKGHLTFHGHVPHAIVANFISAFDIVLLPNQMVVASHGDGLNIGRWTSPLKLFEYMAAGKPIVASDLPVLREVLNDGSNALLCRCDDIQQWLKSLERLRDDPLLRSTLGACAKRDFLNHYTWQARARRILQSI